VDFEGFRVEHGTPTFIEAKGRGYAGRLEQARFDNGGKLVVEGRTATTELQDRLGQLRRQLEVVSTTPGARLRFVAAEQPLVDKLKAYAKDNLAANLFDLIDWAQQDQDWSFKGCV
jgi:hypothetical protein